MTPTHITACFCGLLALSAWGCETLDVTLATFACERDSDCTQGYVCDLARAEPVCVPVEQVDASDDAEADVGCSTACTAINGTASCVDGACQIVQCYVGFANCDGDASNGCEVNLRSNANHCGTCSIACVSGGACRDGSCIGPGDVVDEDTGVVEDIGAACASNASCSLGACFTFEPAFGWVAGYCSGACTDDDACGDDAHCAWNDNESGWCLRDCAVDADCRGPEYACGDIDSDGTRECMPSATGSGEAGAACTALSDCSGGTEGRCILEDSGGWPGGYCSRDCSSTNPCPNGSHCYNAFCIKDCEQDSDCRSPDYGCGDLDGDSVSECWPRATGSGAVGAACTSYSDCSGGVPGYCISEESTGWPGGYCSITCLSNADCDAGCCNVHTFTFDPGGTTFSTVHVAGDFNDWAPTLAAGGWALRRQEDTGLWIGSFQLEDGSYEYRFVLDESTWIQDPANPDAAPNGVGGFNSVITQSCGDVSAGCSAHCGFFGDGSSGVCLATCADATDCTRAGYTCIDADGDSAGTLECAPEP